MSTTFVNVRPGEHVTASLARHNEANPPATSPRRAVLDDVFTGTRRSGRREVMMNVLGVVSAALLGAMFLAGISGMADEPAAKATIIVTVQQVGDPR